MSLLKAWWGGNTTEEEGKKPLESGEGVGDGGQSETKGEPTNPWVKGFGGETVSISLLLASCVVCVLRHCVQC